MQDKLFLDTNILVYLSSESSEFHHSVRERFRELSQDRQFFISRQILREYAVSMTRSGTLEHPLTPDKVVEDLKKWKEFFYIADENESVNQKLMYLISKYQLKGKRIHDANIVATMLENSIPSIFSLNFKDFDKFEEISIIDSP